MILRNIFLGAILFLSMALGGCGGCSGGLGTAADSTTTTLAGGDTTTTTASTTTTTINNVTAPTGPTGGAVRLVFIHQTGGTNWIKTSAGGGLGTNLNANNYYLTETDATWNSEAGDGLGAATNTTDWATWFTTAKMAAVYANSSHYNYNNSLADPGGENEVVIFMSEYPNCEVGGSIDDEKAIYNGLKTYFAAHTDKLFVLVTPPEKATVASYVLTKELCDWLVDASGWLSGYTGKNVAVFDYYCVLSETDSHHRIVSDVATHEYSSSYDGVSPYHDGGDYPNAAGNIKARDEFIPLLNAAYHRFKGN